MEGARGCGIIQPQLCTSKPSCALNCQAQSQLCSLQTAKSNEGFTCLQSTCCPSIFFHAHNQSTVRCKEPGRLNMEHCLTSVHAHTIELHHTTVKCYYPTPANVERARACRCSRVGCPIQVDAARNAVDSAR